MSGKATILLVYDLRRPRLLEYTGMKHLEGLNNYLIREVPLDEVIMPYPPKLDIILLGTTLPNPTELKLHYDYIVVDT